MYNTKDEQNSGYITNATNEYYFCLCYNSKDEQNTEYSSPHSFCNEKVTFLARDNLVV